MIVSVVTRGLSDDCNSTVVSGDAVWLRVAGVGDAFAFHASADGERWDFVRHFALDGDPRPGFLAQSPTGEGLVATFSEIRLEPVRLRDLRSGE
jgi:regulation of enolase protein 1 (concanavalin A-like superfamily)